MLSSLVYKEMRRKGNFQANIFRFCYALINLSEIFSVYLFMIFAVYFAGLDARGFLFGPILSLNLNLPFVPVRKSGKLPGPTVKVSSTKEYGKDVLEMQVDGIQKGQEVVIVDDLLATGGTLQAACQLVKDAGGEVLECVLIVELEELDGKSKVPAPCYCLLKF